MTAFGAPVRSFRPQEIRLREVRAQLGVDFADDDQVDVLVLDAAGNISPIAVAFTKRLAGTVWHVALRCDACAGAASILRVADGQAMCGRCLPVPTRHHLLKNTATWRYEQATADAILRGVLGRQKQPGQAQPARLAKNLKCKTVRRALRLLVGIAPLTGSSSLPK